MKQEMFVVNSPSLGHFVMAALENEDGTHAVPSLSGTMTTLSPETSRDKVDYLVIVPNKHLKLNTFWLL